MGRLSRNTPQELLGLFQSHPELTGAELAEAIGWRFGSSIHILRRRGYDIQTVPLGRNQFLYRFKGRVGL